MHPSTQRAVAKLKRADVRTTTQWLKRQTKATIARTGYLVTRMDDDSRRYVAVTHNEAAPLPPGAEAELRADNPRLADLQRRYSELPSQGVLAAVPTQWNSGFLKRNLSMAWFRGDNAYVWQFRHLGNAARIRMYLTMLDVRGRDRLGLLDKLTEDGLFGAWTFTYGERPPVSRDLLDSVNEISYLDEQMGLSTVEGLRVLDIGAGYGRLAHRMSAGLSNLAAYDCIDGVATSTFLCDYYRTIRAMPDSVRVVPLDEYSTLGEHYDVAVNIHSFSECSLEAIGWWLDRIAERDVEWLLIVPNEPEELLSTELDGSFKPFQQEVLDRGYELADSRPIHQNDELRELIDLHDRFYLFKKKHS